MNILFEVIFVWIGTDFITAVVHWWMDRFGDPKHPWLGESVFSPNREHHVNPRAFVKRSWFKSASSTMLIVIPVILILYLLGILTWHIILGGVLLINVNQMHKWTHRTEEENGIVITFFQSMGLVQSRKHHAQHHLGTQETHYAALTNLLNPILDNTYFWRALEWGIVKFLEIPIHRYAHQ